LRAALQEAMRLAGEVNKYLDVTSPPGSRSKPTSPRPLRSASTPRCKAIDSLKVMLAPFLPFTCQRLHEFFGYQTPLFGEQYTETVRDALGEHTVLRYRPREGEAQWRPSTLQPGAKLQPPAPLYKKLDESLIEEERARLGK
jgi:methionyl-tRNA synthetase